ncbi:hypothetical protein [Egbenema bharatensis]|uniref:hypothetical protein n=1 Tax=Egbenema bharatensis TaxID=3463334 RepID=UPI003A846869
MLFGQDDFWAKGVLVYSFAIAQGTLINEAREHVTCVALTLNPSPKGRGTSIRLPFSLWEKGLGDEGQTCKRDILPSDPPTPTLNLRNLTVPDRPSRSRILVR